MSAPGLSDDALIVRFGVMALRDVKLSLEDAKDDPDVDQYELSFFGGDGLDPEEISRLGNAPNPRMRISTIGRLREAGFDPYPDPPPEGHIGLRFAQMPSDEELNSLISLFDEPVENPHPRE